MEQGGKIGDERGWGGGLGKVDLIEMGVGDGIGVDLGLGDEGVELKQKENVNDVLIIDKLEQKSPASNTSLA
ncbi:hypothetical protein ACH5RR_007095 [Cinchona calisaya]|uniref:Uncharacterized protein n=1 Tax=Cinchona calisaya TaxID=153742 RepID=A0ABD3AQY3_9GENT